MIGSRRSQSTPSLLSDILYRLNALLRREAELASAETAEKLGQARAAALLLLCSAVVGVAAVTLLAEAAVALLAVAYGFSPIQAGVAVGGVMLVAALLAGARAATQLTPGALAPRKTLQSLSRLAETMKETPDGQDA